MMKNPDTVAVGESRLSLRQPGSPKEERVRTADPTNLAIAACRQAAEKRDQSRHAPRPSRRGYDRAHCRGHCLRTGSEMQGLSEAEQEKLSAFNRSVYDAIKEELEAHEGRSVDLSRTRFWLFEYMKPELGCGVVCEIRRTSASLMDLNVGFGDWEPGAAAGPPAHADTWELDLGECLDQTDFNNRLRAFLRDWLEGRLTLITKYAGKKPYLRTLMRGDEVLGCTQFWIFPFLFFAKRRTVSQHT